MFLHHYGCSLKKSQKKASMSVTRVLESTQFFSLRVFPKNLLSHQAMTTFYWLNPIYQNAQKLNSSIAHRFNLHVLRCFSDIRIRVLTKKQTT